VTLDGRRRGDLDAIADAFRAPPDQERELLSLVAWEGLDTEQLATALGCSRNAVRIRLHRARSRFAAALDRQDGPAGVRTPATPIMKGNRT
jgi:RNA polymerase sigma-70 factor (ECF subfamily)